MLDETDLVPATCFFWVPQELVHHSTQDAALADVCNYVVPRAKVQMMREGYAALTMSKMEGIPNFWRFIGNGAVEWSQDQLDSFFDRIHATCRGQYEKYVREQSNKGIAPTA
jgi:hypothetical protein